MTGYNPRSSHDFHEMYSNHQLTTAPYHGDTVIDQLNDSSQLQYHYFDSDLAPQSTNLTTDHHNSLPTMYMQSSTSMGMQYPLQPSRGLVLPSQPRAVLQSSYPAPPLHPQRLVNHAIRPSVISEALLAETEDQVSINEATMRSEPVEPPLDGYPNVDDFDELVKFYVANLSPKKQDKALIHSRRAANIKAVLIDNKTTTIESAQFRFWVKKMFTLEPRDSSIPKRKKRICHDGKPVAIREKLFKILTRAHKLCQHGGRDKTSAQVRRIYSWVPKELISRFVKHCPTCRVRRGTGRASPSMSEKSPDHLIESRSPCLSSNSITQTEIETKTGQSQYHTTNAFGVFSPVFQQQNRWMTMSPLQQQSGKVGDESAKLEDADPSLARIDSGLNHNNQVLPRHRYDRRTSTDSRRKGDAFHKYQVGYGGAQMRGLYDMRDPMHHPHFKHEHHY